MNNSSIPDAIAALTVTHSLARVWAALTDPAEIKQYFFGTDVITDWQVGHPIVWRGEWQGKTFEDHGIVLEFEPLRHFSVTHFSPLTELPDIPENYHTVTYSVEHAAGGTTLIIRQSGNRSAGEVADSEQTWRMVLDGLEQHLTHHD